MSMILTIQQITPRQLAELIRNPTIIHELTSNEKPRTRLWIVAVFKYFIWIAVLFITQFFVKKYTEHIPFTWLRGILIIIVVVIIILVGAFAYGYYFNNGLNFSKKSPLVDKNSLSALDLDKAWHGIHFMLTGSVWDGVAPLSLAILGGTEIGEELNYGPVKYLRPEQVREVAKALLRIPMEKFVNLFDMQAMNKEEIYPHPTTSGTLDYFTSYYEDLADYYEEAAKDGNAIIKYF